MLCLADLPLRALCNDGAEVALLSSVARNHGSRQPDPSHKISSRSAARANPASLTSATS